MAMAILVFRDTSNPLKLPPNGGIVGALWECEPFRYQHFRPWKRWSASITGHHCAEGIYYCFPPSGIAAAVGGAHGSVGLARPVCPYIRQLVFLIFIASCFDHGHFLLCFAVFVGPPFALLSRLRSGPFSLFLFCLFPYSLPSLSGVSAWRERRGRTPRSQATCLLPYGIHPLRGIRVGEAAVPGPGSSSGTPRSRHYLALDSSFSAPLPSYNTEGEWLPE